MKVLDRGHRYQLDHLDGDGKTEIQFVNREGGSQCEGVTTQELIRVLIDRTWYCNDCLPWTGNQHVVGHLRMALALHEARAFIRGVEKGEIEPEFLVLGEDSHMKLPFNSSDKSDYARMPATGTETGSLNPGICAHERSGNVTLIRHTMTEKEMANQLQRPSRSTSLYGKEHQS